jgi:hypothetical protein
VRSMPIHALAAFVLAGCLSTVVGEPVPIAIRTDIYSPNCHTSFTTGTLVPNAETGTAIVEDASSGGNTVPVQWPPGFSAQRVAGVIEVLNQDGKVIARAGEHYRFLGGYGERGWRGCDGVVPEPR